MIKGKLELTNNLFVWWLRSIGAHFYSNYVGHHNHYIDKVDGNISNVNYGISVVCKI